MMNKKVEVKDALKATGTVGGGQVINILISLLRTKVVALLLGTAGVGVIGILTTATDMIRNFSSFGLPFSGVRDISIANGNNDEIEVSRIVKIFNKWVLISSIIGSVITLLFCYTLSCFLFNNGSYTIEIAFLSILIFFSTLNAGYQSVMQGKRAIVMMSKATIIANFFGSILSVLFYFIFKEKGIVPSLIAMGVINFIVSRYFYKKLLILDYEKIKFSESWHSAKGMIRIGLFTIVVSIFDQIFGLGMRAFIADKSGIGGVGLFTAANTIATMYLSIVLSSMASDYYPKLSAIHEDNNKLTEAVNAQLYIVLLLASPIIIGMVGFADLAIKILYSSKFMGAVLVLKWQVIGDFFKIISWPCGFVFLAKGLGKLYVFISISYTIIYMGIVYFGWDYLGFLGIGLSFFIAQFLSMTFTYFYSNIKYKIVISYSNLKVIAVFSVLIIIAFYSEEFLTSYNRIIASALILLISSTYSIYHLNSVIDIKNIISKVLKK